MDPQETKFFTAIILIAIIIGIIILYFIISIVRHQRRYIQLQKERIEAEIITLENERRRIASDLHDDIGPMLSSIKLNINSLDSYQAADQLLISKAGKNIDETIFSLRNIANNLMPNTLLRKGLKQAIQEFIDRMPDTKNTIIRFHCGELPRLEKEKEINIYRIIQEIVHNTIKHAQADTLTLQLKIEKDILLLRSQDNGRGFNFEKTRHDGNGLGLKNLASRAEVMQGTFTVHTSPGKGAEYIFEIPLK